MNYEMLSSLVGKVVKVDRGGPESRVGMLMDVGDDFFTIITEGDGVVIYATHHIKSLTQSSKNNIKLELEIPENFEIKTGSNFKEVVQKLKYLWVKINRGGKETVEGLLESVNDDYLTIIADHEIIRISIFHLRNISYGLKLEKPQREKEEENKGKSNDKETENNED